MELNFRTYLVVCLIFGMMTTSSALGEIPDGKYSYQEDFEEKSPVVQWTSRGKFKVNFAGISDEKSNHGSHSLKLDITFLEDTDYNYWAGPVLDLPAVSGMRMTGDIRIEEAPAGVSVGLGASYYLPALGIAKRSDGRGAVLSLGEVSASRAGQWIRQEGDIGLIGDTLSKKTVGESSPGVRLEKWGILIYCRNAKAGSRLVVYVDNITIDGAIPKGWAKAAELQLTDWRIEFETRQSAGYDQYRAELARLNEQVQKIRTSFSGVDQSQKNTNTIWDDYEKALRSEVEARIEAAEAATTKTPPLPLDPDEAIHDLWDRMVRPLIPAAENLKQLRNNTDPYLIFVQSRPVTNFRTLPDSILIDGTIGEKIEITAAPGEYEPASFVILPNEPLDEVKIEAGDLTSRDSTIAADQIDIRGVKVWYQAGETNYELNKPLLVPELLLNDDALVQVDLAAKRNIIRDIDHPRDAATLLPVSLPGRYAKQFWVTVHVPEDAPAGTYRGVLRIVPANAPAREISLSVEVLPFVLAEAHRDYGLYYRGQLVDEVKHVSSDYKTEAQLEAEFRDMKAHGVYLPDIYQPVSLKGGDLDVTGFEKYLAIKERAGLPLSPLLMLSIGATEATTDEAFTERVRLYEKFMAYARSRGITEVYFYGQDEASGEPLRRQREMWKEVHRVGAKTWAACSTGFFDLVGDVLDLPVIARQSPNEVPRVKALGRKAWVYSWPLKASTGETPYSQRKSWGLKLYLSGMDGLHNYCYQFAEGPGEMAGRPWDDFDSSVYRSLCYTYPTVDGVVSTLQWEAVREGIDDMRYIATLEKAIESAKSSGSREAQSAADKAADWLKKMPVNHDLYEMRTIIIQNIVNLEKLSKR